ncbi:PAS domain S-box-containing protein [Modestobacter sp. DSM 44400]|uniref:SpoIIE family protein phosphatase n=1 Tax=Modestobacter sp. DSM 44400 TaxID=1550230 RepID=UPI00089A0C07|nr:SpoIIE family protein phosphatase [Modestobacter sp. DSM 44400]SDX82952.1 PAS domain S-box-containing protein [Modestobacter sp. DSM 44400]
MTPEASLSAGGSDLLDGLPDAVIVAGDDGLVRYTNAAVTTLLGYDPDALRGRPLTDLMPERFRSAHDSGFSRFLATGRGELFGVTTRVAALTAAGAEIAVDLTLSRLTPPTPGGAGALGGVVVGVLRDAGPAVLLEHQLQVSRYLTATLRVTAALADAPDAGAAFAGLLPTLCEQLDWDAAVLWQPEDSTGRLTCAGTWHAPGRPAPELDGQSQRLTLSPGEGLAGRVWESHEVTVALDLWTAPNFPRGPAARADGVRTGLAFPVLGGGAVLAVCELFSRDSRAVPPELLAVLAGAGRQIGQFLDRLRAEAQFRALAETLQRSLLPARLPAVPGVQLGSRYRAGGEDVLAGGDTYDVLPLPDGRWMVLIADVCGLGAEAAAVTALTRHTARAVAVAGGAPGQVLAAVNAALLQEDTPGPLRFVTACCLLLDSGTAGADVRLSVAGHPLPMLRTADGSCTEVGTPGRALGITAEVSHPEAAVHLGPGSTLVLYTDGITEARDAAGVQFDETGICATLTAAAGLSAQATADAIDEAVARHRGDRRGAGDDLAVLVLAC